MTHFLGVLTQGDRPKPFPYFSLIHESPEGLPAAVVGHTPRQSSTLCTGIQFNAEHPSPGHVLYACTIFQNLFPCGCRINLRTTDSWIRLGKMGSSGFLSPV